MSEANRCDVCGAWIHSFPNGCPTCGAPQCCTQCCKIEWLKSELAAKKDVLIVAFVQGAKWWEYKSTGATMWPSDRDEAEAEAVDRAKRGTLGVVLDPDKVKNQPPDLTAGEFNRGE